MFSRLMRIIKGGDRRKERRVPIRVSATMNGFAGRITDLSLGGCGFYANEGDVLEIGETVAAQLMPPHEDPVEIPALVVGQDDEGMVYCIAFTRVDPAVFDRLQDLIVHQALGGHEQVG